MLPGFRFLFAATLLSTSMLIFGLGAAALLRAAHEEFASIPSRRAPPEIMFAKSDAAPTLAMLRVEPPAAEPKAQDAAPAAMPSTESPAIVSTSAEPEPAMALDVASLIESSSPSETPKAEVSAPEIPAQADTASHDAPPQAEAPSPLVETKLAAIAEATSPEQASAPIDDSARIAQTKIATLGGPPVIITPEASPKKAEPKKSERRAARKQKTQARRAKERRQIAARARTVQQASQRAADPFAQPFGR